MEKYYHEGVIAQFSARISDVLLDSALNWPRGDRRGSEIRNTRIRVITSILVEAQNRGLNIDEITGRTLSKLDLHLRNANDQSDAYLINKEISDLNTAWNNINAAQR